MYFNYFKYISKEVFTYFTSFYYDVIDIAMWRNDLCSLQRRIRCTPKWRHAVYNTTHICKDQALFWDLSILTSNIKHISNTLRYHLILLVSRNTFAILAKNEAFPSLFIYWQLSYTKWNVISELWDIHMCTHTRTHTHTQRHSHTQ